MQDMESIYDGMRGTFMFVYRTHFCFLSICICSRSSASYL